MSHYSQMGCDASIESRERPLGDQTENFAMAALRGTLEDLRW